MYIEGMRIEKAVEFRPINFNYKLLRFHSCFMIITRVVYHNEQLWHMTKSFNHLVWALYHSRHRYFR